MDFEWKADWPLVAVFAAIIPLLLGTIGKAWKWYHKLQSGTSASIQERLAEVEGRKVEKEEEEED